MSLAETDGSQLNRGIRVLSLDGGDFRGLSSLILLRVLMDRITVKENVSATLRPSDYFDFIIGTGTGGLSALFLGRMRMTVDEAINAYLLVGDECFKRSPVPLLQRLQRKEAIFVGDAITRVIGDIVQKFVGDRDAQLQDSPGVMGGFCRTAVLATSSADASAPPFIFRSYCTCVDPASTYSIHQAAYATIATSGAFPPISFGFPPIKFIDAGVAGYNNPSEVALDEVTRVRPDANITCLVSLGIGLQEIVRVGETSEDLMRVSRRLVEDCEKVHNRLRQRSLRDGLPYYRFNVTTGLDGGDITEWDEKTGGLITDITEGYARKPDADVFLNSCASILTGSAPAGSKSQDGYEGSSLSLLNTIKDDALAERISVWLKAPDSSGSYNDACRKHQEGTGAWFIDGEPFTKWQEERASFLSVYGKPGCGKTVLSSSIISHIDNMCQAKRLCACAYFFFDGRHGQQEFQLLDGLIRSLIQQFVYQCAGIPSPLVELYEKRHRRPSTDTLGDLLLQIIRGFTDAYIVIDSLDECAERRELLNWIKKTAVSKTSNLHMLVTSRLEEDIKGTIQSFEPPFAYMDEDLVNQDIHVYIDSIIKGGHLERWSQTVQWQIKNTLIGKAHGMFRWLAMQFEEVENCLDEVELEEQLERLPKDLDETYCRILAKIPEQRRTRVRTFLQWTAFSARPPTLEELVEAGAMEFDQENVPKYNPRRRLRPRDILTACGSLVIESNGCVQLAHFSVKEYLVSDRIANGDAKYFGLSEKLSHSFLAQNSLAYLLRLDSPGPFELETLAAVPLATYAARNWVFHVQSGGGEGVRDICERIVVLMESGNPFANWIRLWDPEYSGEPTQNNRLTTEIGEPLYYTSLLGFTEVSRQLIQRGASVNGQTGGGNRALQKSSCARFGSALQAACAGGHREMVKLLLENGADANAQGGDFGCALQVAALEGHTEIVKLLLESGADVNAQGGEYGSALQAAAFRGGQEVVKLLLESGADIDAQGGEFGSALQGAAMGDKEMVKLLLESGANVNAQGGMFGSALQAAAQLGDEATLKLLLESGADVNAQGGLFGSALHLAASMGNEATVKLFLKSGADLNAQGGIHGNALQAAASRGDEATVKLLVENGADINAQGGWFGCALQAGVCVGHETIMKLLLESGADINAKGGMYGSALQFAAFMGNPAIAQTLLGLGAEVNTQGGLYGSVLQVASFEGHLEIIKLLLANHADVNAQGGLCGNALMAASIQGHDGVVEILLENNADVNAPARDCSTVLRNAPIRDEAFKIFQEKEADEDLEGEYKHALQAASHIGHTTIVKTLLEHDANVNAQGGTYGNALRAALDGGHDEIVKLLLEHGATPAPDLRQENN